MPRSKHPDTIVYHMVHPLGVHVLKMTFTSGNLRPIWVLAWVNENHTFMQYWAQSFTHCAEFYWRQTNIPLNWVDFSPMVHLKPGTGYDVPDSITEAIDFLRTKLIF